MNMFGESATVPEYYLEILIKHTLSDLRDKRLSHCGEVLTYIFRCIPLLSRESLNRLETGINDYILQDKATRNTEGYNYLSLHFLGSPSDLKIWEKVLKEIQMAKNESER